LATGTANGGAGYWSNFATSVSLAKATCRVTKAVAQTTRNPIKTAGFRLALQRIEGFIELDSLNPSIRFKGL
jgi:hypothetical protein